MIESQKVTDQVARRAEKVEEEVAGRAAKRVAERAVVIRPERVGRIEPRPSRQVVRLQARQGSGGRGKSGSSKRSGTMRMDNLAEGIKSRTRAVQGLIKEGRPLGGATCKVGQTAHNT
jgi:hypothetical protein